MNQETFFQTIALVAAVAGVWMTYWTYVSNKRLEIFQTYVDKFNSIITLEDIEWWSYAMENKLPQEEFHTIYELKMLQYLNLVWEEYHLYTERMISRKLWRVWEPNIVFVLNTEFCQYVFHKHQSRFAPNFIAWVHGVSEGRPPVASPNQAAFQGQN